MYRVEWRSLITNLIGYGNWSSNLSEIQAWVDFANKEFPDIIHWVGKKYNYI